jgi:L-rhamnose isomerase
MTLASDDEEIRQFWIRHGQACRRISQQIGDTLDDHVLCNVWIPDGMKDTPADRLSPRLRLKDSLDQIFQEKCPRVIDCVESKVFGIGLESYTVGSSEFYIAYAAHTPRFIIF